MVDEDVAAANGGEQIALLALGSEQQPRRRDRRVRRVAKLIVAGKGDDLHQVAEVDQAVDLIDLIGGRVERGRQLIAQPLAHVGVDLEPHHLAEATPAQLLLDRLKNVVSLVGDVVVGVARDPEERMVDDLHPREQRPEVGGDQRVERNQGVAITDVDEAPEQLLRNLDPGEDLVVLLGVVQSDDQREREVRDVREGATAADHKRRQDGEHLPLEQVCELLALLVGCLVRRDDANPAFGQGRAQLGFDDAADALALLEDAIADRIEGLRREHPVGGAGGRARLDLVLEVGHADHEDLVEVGLPDRCELRALDQRASRRPRRAEARGR